MQENRCLIIKCIFNTGAIIGYCQVNAKDCKLSEEGFRNLDKVRKLEGAGEDEQ